MLDKNIFESFVKKKIKKEEAIEKNDDLKYAFQDHENFEEEIFDFQKEKEKIMEKMHQLLKAADEGKEITFEEKDLISIGFDGEKYFTYGKKSGEISKGDITIASLWGKNLKLNAEVDRKTKKEFILREARQKISSLWEKQLILAGKNTRDTTKAEAYSGLEKSLEKLENKDFENVRFGHLAERMIESMFLKITENNPDLPFTFEGADVYDDVEYKADFYLHVKKEFKRGVNIGACETGDCDQENIGIQYTGDANKTETKQNQIEKSKKFNQGKIFDDLVLVSIPLNSISDALKKWMENKKDRSDFSGPEKFLSLEEQKKIFIGILEKLPNYLEINAEKLWEDL